MLAAFFEIATAAARWCSLLLSWMMASRPSCRDFSLIRWDLVFLLSKVLTTSQCTTTSKQVGSCLANANSKIFFACGANKKAFGQIDQPKGTKPREIRTLGVRRKVELRLQRADRQQTKKTKNKPKKTKDAKKKRCAVHHLSL